MTHLKGKSRFSRFPQKKFYSINYSCTVVLALLLLQIAFLPSSRIQRQPCHVKCYLTNSFFGGLNHGQARSCEPATNEKKRLAWPGLNLRLRLWPPLLRPFALFILKRSENASRVCHRGSPVGPSLPTILQPWVTIPTECNIYSWSVCLV